MGKRADGYVSGGNVINPPRERERRWHRDVRKKMGIALGIILSYVVFQLGFAFAVGLVHF